MAKYKGVGGCRIGKVGNERYYLRKRENEVSVSTHYTAINSQWIKKEEFKEYVISLLGDIVPQIYVLDALPEQLYPYALIFVQTEEEVEVYVDKEGIRTKINLEGSSSDYDAVDVVQDLPENPRNNVIYLKQDNADTNDPPVYTMYVSENDTLTKIDLGSIEIQGFPPIVVNENNTISLNYSTDHFVLQQGKLTAGPLETQIASKQDKLVSGSNIRTVGGNNLVNASLINQDIEPSDIMNLSEPLKWDTQDSYKLKLGYNSNDFELDANNDLKLKGIDVPVTGAVSPLFIDNNKKVNLGVVNANGLKVANNNLQMTVSAPLFQSTGNNLNFRYSTTDFSVTSNTFNATPLKTAIGTDLATLSNAITANTTAITNTSRLVGIFSNTSAQATTSNAWKSLRLATSNDVNTDYCELLGDRILFNKNAIYKFTVTCRLVDTIGVMTPLCWTLGVSGTDDTINGGDWIATVQRHKSTQVFVIYVTKSTGVWPRVYIENSSLNCQYVRIVLEAMKG